MNDIDLEHEFQLLKDAAIKQIGDKLAKGELTDEQADKLTDMVQEGMNPPQTAWSSSGCSYDDGGWSGSSITC